MLIGKVLHRNFSLPLNRMSILSFTCVNFAARGQGRDPSGRLEIWDAYLPGFGYRATQRGKGAFFIMYRLKGQRRRMTVGRYPVLPLAEARVTSGNIPTPRQQRRRPACAESVP